VAYPDMQRARMACAHFREFGWEPLILAVDPDEQVGPKDHILERTVPNDVRIWRAGAVSKRLARLVGVRSVGYRSFRQFAALGSRIIEQEGVDVVFFSTTMFMLFALGPYWKWRHGVPFVLDFQDPWLSDQPMRGGSPWARCKRSLTQVLARFLEPVTVRAAAQIICVSPSYPEMLGRRYPDIPPERFTVLPFAAAAADFRLLESFDVTQQMYDPRDGREHWVYAGRGGADMRYAIRAFMIALSAARRADPGNFARLLVHFIGTDYAAGAEARSTSLPIAMECGVGDLVREHPERIGYFPALQCLRQADALFVPGSTDSDYTASKIYPYILAGKPMLAVFHERSSVAQVIRETACGTLVTFRDGEDVAGVAARIGGRWFGPDGRRAPETKWDKFDAYSARTMTRTLSDILMRALKGC
jgi:hypothetical protein